MGDRKGWSHMTVPTHNIELGGEGSLHRTPRNDSESKYSYLGVCMDPSHVKETPRPQYSCEQGKSNGSHTLRKVMHEAEAMRSTK